MRLAALAVAARVDRDDAEVLGQVGDDAGLAPVGLDAGGEPVHQDDGLTLALDGVADLDAVRIEVEILRRRIGRRPGGNGQEQRDQRDE